MLPEAIHAAAARIDPYIRRTPVLRLAVDDVGLRYPLVLKLELLQHAGSFKARGAFHRLLTGAIPAAGVIAASGGNHGAAVAYAAARLAVPAEIFVPAVADPAKLARIRAYGARLTCVGSTYADAYAASELRAARTGAMQVHAYDHPDILAGQGTVGLEFEADAPELTHVLVAVGGGGLVGGVAGWYAGRTSVIAVEPTSCPTLHAALQAGHPVPVEVGGVAADSLGASQVGQGMFPIARRYVAVSVLVPDSAIVAAQHLLWERFRLITEPGGATALAALLCRAFDPGKHARVGVVICGGNTDPAKVARLPAMPEPV